MTVGFREGQWPYNLRLLGSVLDHESLEYAIPQFSTECISFQTSWALSLAKQDSTHSVLDIRHFYEIVQADLIFLDLRTLSVALEIRMATDTGKLATQNV